MFLNASNVGNTKNLKVRLRKEIFFLLEGGKLLVVARLV
jgi:hypothetical protein